MIWCVLTELPSKNFPQRKTVFTPPRDASLRINAFKVTDEQHSKINSRSNPRTPTVGVTGLGERFDKQIKPGFRKQFVPPIVKHMSRGLCDVGRCDSQFLLLFGYSLP